MTTNELIKKLQQYPGDSEVTLCFWNGEGTMITDIELVVENGGPSIYAPGWRDGEFHERCPNCGSDDTHVIE